MNWLTDRIKEPSTHAALSALLACAAYVLPQYSPLIVALASAFGFGGVVMSERK